MKLSTIYRLFRLSSLEEPAIRICLLLILRGISTPNALYNLSRLERTCKAGKLQMLTVTRLCNCRRQTTPHPRERVRWTLLGAGGDGLEY